MNPAVAKVEDIAGRSRQTDHSRLRWSVPRHGTDDKVQHREIVVDRNRQRADFSPNTRNLIAERAGFRCSFPGCGQLTVGPAAKPNKSSNIGRASHVYGAALSGKGPRGTGGLNEEELASPVNGIWLCPNHADLIDKDDGNDYPADRLHSYKTAHEMRVAREVAGIHSPFGWVEKVRMRSSALFAADVEVAPAKLTLIIGGNCVGKTALCEWIAASVDAHYLERWAEFQAARSQVRCDVSFLSPDPHVTGFCLERTGSPTYTLDGIHVMSPVAPLKVVFPQEIRFADHEGPKDDLKCVAEAIGLHSYDVWALLDELNGGGHDTFKQVWFEEDEEGRSMCVRLATYRGEHSAPLRLMASSERAGLLIQLGIQAANQFAARYPTLLLLDEPFCRFDTDWMRHHAEVLCSPALRFQTIATTRRGEVDFDGLTWGGWKIVSLEGQPPDVIVRKGFREADGR